MGRTFLFIAAVAFAACFSEARAESPREISRAALLDKIRGAWAAQMIGVSYGAPTEFKSNGKIIEGEIVGADLENAIDQDDLYVEMTFAQVMDSKGLDATTADYGAAFKDSKYRLWHANAAARRNLNRGIEAPLSGHPKYNLHADDIDFQIEADFIGIMCPGLPKASNAFCDRVGRVMNYGDGLYGGMFIAGMYSAAFFESDPRRVVQAGLACIPAESPYGQTIADLLAWSKEEPTEWRQVWKRLDEKWDKDDVCPDGAHRDFNIDAKLNGAYVAMGLLYGKGEWHETMDVATRCGQDSDCNPASALGVLGAIRGFDALPRSDQEKIAKLADTKFTHTNYSFNEIVRSTEARALEVIRQAGGTVDETKVTVPHQAAEPPKLELWDYGKPVKSAPVNNAAWKWKGAWADVKDRHNLPARETTAAGSEASLSFEGTGLALVSNLAQDGGRADVYIDGAKHELVADCYIVPNTIDDDLWRVFGLAPGNHEVRIVVREDADPRSQGRRFMINRAIVYQSN